MKRENRSLKCDVSTAFKIWTSGTKCKWKSKILIDYDICNCTKKYILLIRGKIKMNQYYTDMILSHLRDTIKLTNTNLTQKFDIKNFSCDGLIILIMAQY